MLPIDPSLALTVQSVDIEAATSAAEDLFASILSSRAQLLERIRDSDELTQERFKEQSTQLVEMISDLGNGYQELISQKERNRDLKIGHKREVKSFSEVIGDICRKVTLINRSVLGDSGAEEITTDEAIIPASASIDIHNELSALAAAVDLLAQSCINLSEKVRQETLKSTAAISEVEVLKALIAAEQLEANRLRASHAEQISSITASCDARMQAVAAKWLASGGYHTHQKDSYDLMRKYQHLENVEHLKRSGIVTFQS